MFSSHVVPDHSSRTCQSSLSSNAHVAEHFGRVSNQESPGRSAMSRLAMAKSGATVVRSLSTTACAQVTTNGTVKRSRSIWTSPQSISGVNGRGSCARHVAEDASHFIGLVSSNAENATTWYSKPPGLIASIAWKFGWTRCAASWMGLSSPEQSFLGAPEACITGLMPDWTPNIVRLSARCGERLLLVSHDQEPNTYLSPLSAPDMVALWLKG